MADKITMLLIVAIVIIGIFFLWYAVWLPYASRSFVPPNGGGLSPPEDNTDNLTSYQLTTADGASYQIGYEISGGEISSITADANITAILVQLQEASSDGQLTLHLPRDPFIEGFICTGEETLMPADDNLAFVDGEYSEVSITVTESEIITTVQFWADSEEIEIIVPC